MRHERKIFFYLSRQRQIFCYPDHDPASSGHCFSLASIVYKTDCLVSLTATDLVDFPSTDSIGTVHSIAELCSLNFNWVVELWGQLCTLSKSICKLFYVVANQNRTLVTFVTEASFAFQQCKLITLFDYACSSYYNGSRTSRNPILLTFNFYNIFLREHLCKIVFISTSMTTSSIFFKQV